MSQRAIKKKVTEHKHVVRVPVQPLPDNRGQRKPVQPLPDNRGSRKPEPAKALPDKSFPMKKFIALPPGLRPKTVGQQGGEGSSPRRTTPVKAVAVPVGTSSSDSRARVYMLEQPEGGQHTVTNTRTSYTGEQSPHTHLHNTTGQHQPNGHVRSARTEEPYATSTPRTSRREAQKRAYRSAQNSPRESPENSPRGHNVPNGSISSVGSDWSLIRKRIYKKRSSSAPPDNRQRGLVDTDVVLNKWTDNEQIPGLSKTVSYHSVQDGVVIEGENWGTANIGHSRQVYRTNSAASGHSRAGSVTSNTTYSTGSASSIANLEFTDVCNLNPDSSVESYSVSAKDFIRSDTVRGDYAGVNTSHDFSDLGSRYSNGGVSLTGQPSHKFVRSWSELNMDQISVTGSTSGLPKTYTVNGAPQTGIVIYQPGKKERIFVPDQHRPVPRGDQNLEFLTIGRKSGTLMQSKMKFSSMPTLNNVDSKGDKKLLKLLKKQEKEERKRKEKEEKKRAKEEKKRIKLEKKLKTKTLPRNFAYQNGHITSPGMENIYRRPMLSMSAVPIDFEDGPGSKTPNGSKTPTGTLSKSSAPPKMAPPPPPGPSQRTMSLYASAPDLQRIEQIYGATIRGVPKEYARPVTVAPTISDYTPRTVVLQRAAEGYGFVLRGAKSQLKPNGELDFRPTPEFPALQYLDSVDPGSVSDKAGLKPGDFILEINGENVVRASHDRVVHLIRGTGDTLAMKVVTVKPSGRAQDWFVHQDKSLTLPNRKKKAAPAPPQRDPRTSLSISRSEGGSMSEELAAMASLDQAIGDKKLSEEKKTASIRSRTAAKRVSVVDMENIGVQSNLERSKSTPDLLDGKSKDAIYATPQIPGTTIVNGTVVTIRPKGPPPAPPAENMSPKKQAPKPPGSGSGSEVVTISTTKPTQYASVTVHVNKDEKPASPYESSFRPGDSAKMKDDPSMKELEKDEKQNVSFAEDKVMDYAASFLKKHPNAKLLITNDAQKKVRNRSSGVFEPEPDYENDSGEDKPASPDKVPDKRQSVTVISVGQKKPAPSTASNRYTVHSTIPSDQPPTQAVQAHIIPPRPDGPAPTPPNQSNQSPRQQMPKFAAPPPPVAKVPPLPDSTPPSVPQTPPPDFKYEPPQKEEASIPKSEPLSVPAAPPPPPPPPPAPPAPSADDLVKEKTETHTELTSRIPVHSIAAAVAKRQERIDKQGINVNASASKPNAPPAAKNDTQAAILAAVARRRAKLEKQEDNTVVDEIESRLQKTKKLQAAKFSLASTKSSPRREPEVKSSDTVQKKPSVVQSVERRTVVNSQDKPMKEQSRISATELSFKVKPVKAPAGVTEIKPRFTNQNSSSVNVNGTSTRGGGLKKQESLKLKPEPLEKTIASEINATQKPQEQSNKTNGQSDFLALAEKKRQEYLQRKQKSAEQKSPPDSKSSSVAGTPERKTNLNKQSPPVSAKPKSSNSSQGAKTESYQSPRGLVKVKTVSNGDAGKSYTSVPPPPPGFRDGGNVENTVVQLEIIPPPMNFSSADSGVESSTQHSPAFSPDTASLVSSISTLSSLSGDQNDGRGYDDLIAPPPPGFEDNEPVIAPPPQFGGKKAGKFSDKSVESWLCIDVLDWLDSLKLSQYKDSFQRNCIDGKKLVKLGRNNYIELGVTQVAHRMNIERAIKKASLNKPQSKEIIASEHL